MDIIVTHDNILLFVMAKPIGSACNLKCDYCYYLEKERMYQGEQNSRMSDDLLERYIRNYIESQPRPEVLFTWHGGEPLMRGLDFFKKAIKLQQYYSRVKGIRVDNSLQTNGTMLTDEWCEFFARNNFLIGVSLDGPAHCHNRYRLNRSGVGSHAKVLKGIQLMQKHKVEFNVPSVVNNYNVNYPLEVYNHFKEIGAQFIQFTPIVERIANDAIPQGMKLQPLVPNCDCSLAEWSVDPLAYGRFLTAVFDEWIKNDVGKYYVINFDSTLANWVGEQPSICIHAETCGHAMAMEHNGDVFACDHFVFPEYKRGNIWEKPLLQMLYAPEQIQFGKDKRDKLPTQCNDCEYLFACNGECPKNRIVKTSNGEEGLNYLCAGFKYYFSHLAPYMDFMAEELKNKRPPANVMQWAKQRDKFSRE